MLSYQLSRLRASLKVKISIGKLSLTIALFFTLQFSLSAQEQSSGKNDRFKLINSDKLFLSSSEQENVLELFGNAHFFYGNIEFYCNKAQIFETRKIAKLIGNVRVLSDTLSLNADSVSYNRTTDVIDLLGNVVIIELKQTEGVFNRFVCNKGTYDRAQNIIIAQKNVNAESRKDNVRARCNYAYWDRKNGYGYLLEKPEFWSEDKDTIYVRAEKMEFFDSDKKLIATFNVSAQSKDYKVTSDFLLFFLNENKAIFQGEPRFTADYADAKAVEFYLYFEDRKLSRAELKDSCTVWFSEDIKDQKNNWIKASYVTMMIKNNNLKDFIAENNVSYYYEQLRKDDKDFFSNNASGSILEATFNDDGKLNNMKIKNKVSGFYRFDNNK